jgi:hypothetical protein
MFRLRRLCSQGRKPRNGQNSASLTPLNGSPSHHHFRAPVVSAVRRALTIETLIAEPRDLLALPLLPLHDRVLTVVADLGVEPLVECGYQGGIARRKPEPGALGQFLESDVHAVGSTLQLV